VVVSSPVDDQLSFCARVSCFTTYSRASAFPHGPERFLIHQPHRTPARGVPRATAAVVCPFARTRVSRTAGVQRAVGATDDVDEVHASIVAGSAPPGIPDPKQTVSRVR
jgi:hypothetical protein